MNIYSKRSRWKILLLLFAIGIGIGSLYYTNGLVEQLADEERKKVELWAEATRQLVDNIESSGFLLDVIRTNETVPVMLVNEDNEVLYYRNLDSVKVAREKSFERIFDDMQSYTDPIVIHLPGGDKQFLYYTRSIILTKLTYYPYIQLGAVCMFVLIAYFAFSASRKAEQNQVWVGLSKETAHQLGTPISSLLAWTELLKQTENEEVIKEFKKDVHRLEKITERFSKIGSQPKLVLCNLREVLNTALNYMRTRVSEQVQIQLLFESGIHPVMPLNQELFEWVIENLCKNAIDAMGGKGKIDVRVSQAGEKIFIDVQDSGKGIHKNKIKTIFKPGYTTKNRGWGLGLSLVRRIIEEYHQGKIFVSNSELGKGTTFRIVLHKTILS